MSFLTNFEVSTLFLLMALRLTGVPSVDICCTVLARDKVLASLFTTTSLEFASRNSPLRPPPEIHHPTLDHEHGFERSLLTLSDLELG